MEKSMTARRTLTIGLATMLVSGCAATRHASQPSVHEIADVSRYEVKRSGNMLTRYNYMRDVDEGEAVDLAPLFDHYPETRNVQRAASRYEHLARWAAPTAMLASLAMLSSAGVTGEHERELGIAALSSAAIGAIVTTVAHLLGQDEYGELGDLYNERLREEAAGR
jgi:hypothetical protein